MTTSIASSSSTSYPKHDPMIYENICKIYPKNIRAIYIRQIGSRPKSEVTTILRNIEGLGVSTCYFEHSQEAILHSVREGIITQEALEAFGKEKVKSE